MLVDADALKNLAVNIADNLHEIMHLVEMSDRSADNESVGQHAVFKSEVLEYLRQSEERIAHLESLVQASRILNSTLNLEEILRLFMDIATKNMQADRSTLYLVDRKKDELWSIITQGPEMVEIRLPIGMGIAGQVAKTGEVINIDDPYHDPRFFPDIDRKTGYTTRNILCMPMLNKKGEIIGVMQILNKHAGNFTTDDESYLDSLAAQAAVAIENAQLHRESLERRRLEAELRVAFQIQQTFLPRHDPQFSGFTISGINIPCQEVGGDYFGYIDLGHQLGIAIGDVSGKGVPAALLMANLQATLSILAPLYPTTNELLTRINLLLKSSSTASNFITFFYGLLDRNTRTFTYTNAGHNPPFLYRPGEETNQLTTGDTILGAFNDAEYHEFSVQLQSRDILVLYTDGITEATDNKKEQFGEFRLISVLEKNRDSDARVIRDAIIDEISSFTTENAYGDDVTLIVITAL